MKNTVYFDNAATTYPKPESVYYEMYRCIREYCGNPGRGSNRMALAASECIYNCRSALKSFFNAELEENVIFTYNATYAINMALKCFVKRGTNVLISDVEHNAVYRPVVSEALKGNITFRIFSSFGGNAERILSDIKRKITQNTSAIICTGASNISNLRMPIKEIGEFAKSKRILFILDASQLAGHSFIDMQKNGISILCAPFHKGLYGPQGGGFMIVDKKTKPTRTLIEGGSGYNSKDMSMPSTLPEMLEAGTLSTPCAAGLLAGLEYLNSAGLASVMEYERHVSGMLRELLLSYEELSLCGDYTDGCVFSVKAKGMDTDTFATKLDEHGILVRGGLHCAPLAHKSLGTQETGTVRFSTGIFNTESDIDCLDQALKRILL